MDTASYYKRTPEGICPNTLAGKSVIAVGAGSGGGFICTELARAGTSLLVIDRPGEVLEKHNIARHVCGYPYLGQPKTAALAAHIHNMNPHARVATAECDVVANPEQFEGIVQTRPRDLILDCLDDPVAKHMLADVARRHRIPLIGAGVYDGGVGGEVYRVFPDGPCYGCIAAALNLPRQTTRKHKHVNYENPDRNEARSTSALNLHIAQIGIFQAQLALNALLGEKAVPIGIPPEVNIITYSNRIIPGVFSRPWHAEFFATRRDPACLVCGNQNDDVEAEAARILQTL